MNDARLWHPWLRINRVLRVRAIRMKRRASSAWSTSTVGGLMSSREVAGIVLIAAWLMAGTAAENATGAI